MIKRLLFSTLILLTTVLVVSASPPHISHHAARRIQPSPITLAFVTNNPSDYWTACRKGAEAAARGLPGISLQFVMPDDGTAATQKRDVDDLIARGVRGIAISPVDPMSETPAINIWAMQIPLITADNDAPQSKRRCFVGGDNHTAGVQAGQLMRTALPHGGKIMLFVGLHSAQNAAERIQGIYDALRGSNVHIIGVQDDSTDHGRAYANAAAALTAHPDLAGMIGIWSYNGPAILAAVRAAGKVGKVKIISFDAEPGTVVGVASKAIYGMVTQQPYQSGYQSIRLLAHLAHGSGAMAPASGQIIIPMQVVTWKNVAAWKRTQTSLLGQP